MHLTMKAAEKGLGEDFYKICADYVERWVLPRSKSQNLARLFTAKRKEANKSAETFKRTASEALALYPIFTCLLANVVQPLGICCMEITACIHLRDVLELLQAVPHGVTTPQGLRTAVEGFLCSARDAGWQEDFHPKFHWILHLPRHLAKFGCLPSCWVQERKHRHIKRQGALMHNTSHFDNSLLVEALGQTLAEYQDEHLFDTAARLHQKCKPSKQLRGFLLQILPFDDDEIYTCAAAHLAPTGHCHKGDVVIMRSYELAEIYFHAEVGGKMFSLVNVLKLQQHDWKHGICICEKQEAANLVSTESIVAAVAYSKNADGSLRALIPRECRP